MKQVKTSLGKLFIASKDDILDLLETPKQMKFQVIFNLAQELDFLVEDEKNYAECILFGDIKDYSIPSDMKLFREQVDFVVQSLKDGHKCLIHCMSGVGRSGMVLGCILKKLENKSNNYVLGMVKSECNGPETQAQISIVRSF